MLPALQNSDLPQADALWDKVRRDLARGFKVTSFNPHPNDIIRVYTRHNENWQFLLVASANQTMPPVFSLEMHIYPPEQESYQLNLTHFPIPSPKWSHTWKTLVNMLPHHTQPDTQRQNHIISTYLASEFDEPATHNAFHRTQSSKWLVE